jgi:nitroreductase
MDAYEAAATKLDVREFAPRQVPAAVKLKILEVARLAQSGTNSQHWRFVLVRDPKNIKTLAEDSLYGKWIAGADFAVIVLTDPKRGYHEIDAGRAVQAMQVAAWGLGVASCVFTGMGPRFREHFGVPTGLDPTIVVGFGYPARKLTGRKKDRKPLSEVAFLEKYGSSIDDLTKSR